MGLKHRILSVPIHFKILGIGSIVAILFGTVVVLVVHTHVRSTLDRALDDQSVVIARWLASRLERPLITADRFGVHEILQDTWNRIPNLSYLMVRDHAGRVTGLHTPGLTPPKWREAAGPVVLRPPGQTDPARIIEADAPVLDGVAGRVRVGFDDGFVTDRLASIDRMLLIALAACMVLGQGLALGLTYLLTRPLQNLVAAARSVEKGNLDVVASGYYDDEIGRLSKAFNSMVAGLRNQQSVIERKEEQRQRLLKQVISSQEDERARIARELHDELGPSLSALLMQLRTEKGARPECSVHREEMEESVCGIIEQVRSMAWTLRPSILDDYGLESCLQRLVDEVSARGECKVDFTYVRSRGAGDRLDPTIEVALYRVAQEAVTNVVRHSGAARAGVVLYHHPDRVVLLIEDDGKGFNLDESVDDKERLGLIGMRERVELMGGEFVIETAPGRGTTVRATLPLGG